jgi:RNA polymerase sigma factor (sigma-70 family)
MRPTSPPVAPARYDLDLSRLEDEQLVVLAVECHYCPARDELIRRSLPLKERLISWYAAHRGLQEADLQDVQQEAFLWIVEAIRHYRAEEQAERGGCRFRSFLHRVLAARFIDFLRHRRRLQSHFPLTGVGPWDPNRAVSHRHQSDTAAATGGEMANPVRGAEEDEQRAHVLGELARLGEAAGRLWDLLADGVSLREVARALNLSYGVVKRRRRQLLVKLRAFLDQKHDA